MSVDKIIDEVVQICCSTGNKRQKQIFESLVKHLHGFVADIKPSDEEWMSAIEFLTAVGNMCDDKRQEFILLSDVLGVTALKDHLNNIKPEVATDATVLGPFYREGVEIYPLGTSISSSSKDGERCLIKGRVTDIDGNPIKNALLDVWQAAANGLYEQQDKNQTDMNLRGGFETDADGYFWFETVKPKYYPIPTDGPVGKMLKTLGRHEFRPGHIHFIVSAAGFEPVTTQYFDKNSKYIDSDPVFGVKDSLVIDFNQLKSDLDFKGVSLHAGDWVADCPFVLIVESAKQ